MQQNQIVYVDDNSNDHLIMDLVIKKFNIPCSVKYINNGQDAIEYFTTNIKPAVDLIFLDINLSPVDGFSILKSIRSNNKYIPIVMITSSINPNDIKKVYDMGASAYIVKPFERNETMDCISTAIHFWLKFNVIP